MSRLRSPLKGKALRHPGQSLDEQIERVIDEGAIGPYAAVACLWGTALVECWGYWMDMPRRPWIFLSLAMAGTVWFGWSVFRARRRVQTLRLGRDGERVVGQFLDGLRESGARIFHDVPAPGFNLDHVVISSHGIFVVETKTVSKPDAHSTVVYDGETVTVAGFKPHRDPVRQAASEARWLRGLLSESTGRQIHVRGVVVYPNWWIEQIHKERPRDVWVLEPKALPKWIENEPVALSPDEVAMTAFHLAQYVRNRVEDKK